MKADPFAQLKLLDVQALDARADQLRHQRAHLPEIAEIATLTASRADLVDRARDQQIAVDDLTAGAAEGRRRRRAGQDPPHPRPGPDGPGADQQPQGPRADAARAGLPRAPDHHPRGRGARGDGAARGGPGRTRRRCSDSWRRPTSGWPRWSQSATGGPPRSTPSSPGSPASAGRWSRTCRTTCSRSTTGCGESKGGVGAAELRARQCGGCRLTLDNSEISPDQGRSPPTRWSAARSASGSWCAPPRADCERRPAAG